MLQNQEAGERASRFLCKPSVSISQAPPRICRIICHKPQSTPFPALIASNKPGGSEGCCIVRSRVELISPRAWSLQQEQEPCLTASPTTPIFEGERSAMGLCNLAAEH